MKGKDLAKKCFPSSRYRLGGDVHHREHRALLSPARKCEQLINNSTGGINMRVLLIVIGAVALILLLMRGMGQRETKAVEEYATMRGYKALASGLRETGRDGRFIAYDNGTVLDTRTSLMWASKDNGRNINWQDAKNYCDNYRGGDYTGWRMPTQDELAGLYDNSKSYKATKLDYNVHLTELIKLSTSYSWASETRGSEAASFFFQDGQGYWENQSYLKARRVLPVRSAK